MKMRHDRKVPDTLPEEAPAFVEDKTKREGKTFDLLTEMFDDAPFLPLVYTLVRDGGKPVSVREVIWTLYDEPDTPETRAMLRKDLVRLRARHINRRIPYRVIFDSEKDTLRVLKGDPRKDQIKHIRDNIPNIVRDYHRLKTKHPQLSDRRAAHVLDVPESSLRRWLRWDREGRLDEIDQMLRTRSLKAARTREQRQTQR